MSTQTTSLILGQHIGALQDETSASDLQKVIGKVFTTLRYRYWLFVFPLLTGMLITLIVGLLMPRQFMLNTIFERRDDVAISNLVKTNSPYSFQTLRRSLPIDLLGYHALGTAVDQLGLTASLERDEQGELTPQSRTRKQQLVAQLAADLSINLMEKSDHLDLIEIKYKGTQPDLGVQLVAQLTDNYICNMETRINEILSKSLTFFGTEAERANAKASKLEAELLKLASEHPGIDPDDPDLLGQRIMSQQLAIEKLLLDKAETDRNIRARVDYLQQLQQSNQPPGLDNRVPSLSATGPKRNLVLNSRHQQLLRDIDRVKTEISDAQALRQMTDKHPHIVSLRGKLERLRSELKKQPQYIPDDLLTAENDMPVPLGGPSGPKPIDLEQGRVENELKTLREKMAVLNEDLNRRQARIAELEKQKVTMFEQRQHFLITKQEMENAKADHGIWKRHMDSVGHVLTAEQEQHGISFAVVESARKPARPFSPTISGIFLLALGVGLGLGTSAVFLREVFDRSFRDPSKVRQSLGLPVLETIGNIKSATQRSIFGRRLILPALAGVEAVFVIAAGATLVMSLQHPELYERMIAHTLSGQWLASIMGS